MVCFCVLSVRAWERVTLIERESGRDASWKMTAFNKYVGGKTLHYTEEREKNNSVSLGIEIAIHLSRFKTLRPVVTVR